MLERGYFGRSIQIIATNPFEFLVAGALLGGLVVGSGGLLAGPAAGGVISMTLKRCRGEDIDLGDAFGGFENFTTTFLAGIALLGMVGIGTMLLLVPGWILGAVFMFTLPVAVDRNVSAGEALRQARLLGTKDLLAQMIFAAVLLAVGAAGAVFLIVGLCVSVPVALSALTLAYHDAAYPPNTAPGAAEI
jgi:uncharacterized membrane protein